jgi:hypothetical protein
MLFERVVAFLEHLGGRPIDAMQGLDGERADYVVPTDRIVVEIKSLVDDREASVAEVLAKWSPTFGLVYGAPSLAQLLRKNPHRDQINREVFDAAIHTIEPAFRKANRQIRAMRRDPSMADWCGLLVFVVEDIYFFEPRALEYEISRLFQKRTEGGVDVRFPHIDWVFVASAAHVFLEDNGTERSALMSMQSPTTPHHDRFPILADDFIARWCSFNGIRFSKLTPEEIATLKMLPRRTPDIRIRG